MFRLFAIFSLIITVAACEHDPNRRAVPDADGGVNGFQDPDGISSGSLDNITPGSQQDLVANIGDRIFFGFNSAALSENAQKTLNRQADWLNNNPGVTITVEGHCDERGTREYNLALGERRANAVSNYLVSRGVDGGRVTTISYGKEHPEYLGTDEVSWSKNRRAVTVAN